MGTYSSVTPTPHWSPQLVVRAGRAECLVLLGMSRAPLSPALLTSLLRRLSLSREVVKQEPSLGPLLPPLPRFPRRREASLPRGPSPMEPATLTISPARPARPATAARPILI